MTITVRCWEARGGLSAPEQRYAGASVLRARYRLASARREKHLRAVLGDAAITHLAKAELAFHLAKDVLDFCADFAEPLIVRALRRVATEQ